MTTSNPDIEKLSDYSSEAALMYTTNRDGEWVKTDAIKEVEAMTKDERQWHLASSTEARYKWVTSHDDMAPPFEVIKECAEASIGFGLNPEHVDWDRFYDYLESYGWEMDEYSGKADGRLHRIVNKARKEGEINW